MLRVLRLAHIIGVVMVLGSICTFNVVSALTEGASLENLAFGRRVIGAGTNTLTIPGLCVLAVSGVWMGLRSYGVKHRFLLLKLALIALVAANGALFIAPLVASATEIATRSLALGRLLPVYQTAFAQETMFGTANMVAILAAAVIGVWRTGAPSTTPNASAESEEQKADEIGARSGP